ncbi:MAG: hypothetical protein AB7K24_34245, partial [Gemmataceae bacterium]
MTRRRMILAVALLLLLIGGAGAWYFRPNPDVARVKALGNELIEKAKESLAKGEMPFDRNNPNAKELKEAMDKLSPEERREVGMEMGLNFMSSMANMIVAAPEPLRNFVLDKAIDQMENERQRREERRAEAEQRRAAAEAEGRDPSPGDEGQRSFGDEQRRERRR